MSHYGRGRCRRTSSAIARARRQADDPAVFQIYFTGCAGDTAAGKYNDGRPEKRAVLAERVYAAMVAAWDGTEVRPLDAVVFRSRGAEAPGPVRRRLRARGRSSGSSPTRRRPAGGGTARRSASAGASAASTPAGRSTCPASTSAAAAAQFLVLPAETFVGYQLAAQQLRPAGAVMVAGFGDGAPGYLPTDECYADGWDDPYSWVEPGVEGGMMGAIRAAMGVAAEPTR